MKHLSLSFVNLNSVIKVNVKLSICLPLRHMERCLHVFVTSPLDRDMEMIDQVHILTFVSGEGTSVTILTGDWADTSRS